MFEVFPFRDAGAREFESVTEAAGVAGQGRDSEFIPRSRAELQPDRMAAVDGAGDDRSQAEFADIDDPSVDRFFAVVAGDDDLEALIDREALHPASLILVSLVFRRRRLEGLERGQHSD